MDNFVKVELSNTPSQSEIVEEALEATQTVEKQPAAQKVQSVRKRRRLATTRGLSSSGRGASQNLITPNNTPLRTPVITSTPITTDSIPASRQALPFQGISSLPVSVQLPPHPPYSPAGQYYLPLPGPAVQPPRTNRVSVISPRIFVTGASSVDPDPSLDWDNFDDSPSYRLSQAALGLQKLNIRDCLEDIEDLTGVEDIRKITLVDTTESSLSGEGQSGMDQQNTTQNMQSGQTMSNQDRELLGQEMLLENQKLTDMRDIVFDMMEDYTADDVRRGNVELVQRDYQKLELSS